MNPDDLIDHDRTPDIVHAELPMSHPVYLEPGWRIARTVKEALDLIDEHGYPSLISFDHDLAQDPVTKKIRESGLDLAKILVERDMDTADMPADFRYMVHSMNGEGAKNIRGLLDGYLADRTPGQVRPRLW